MAVLPWKGTAGGSHSRRGTGMARRPISESPRLREWGTWWSIAYQRVPAPQGVGYVVVDRFSITPLGFDVVVVVVVVPDEGGGATTGADGGGAAAP